MHWAVESKKRSKIKWVFYTFKNMHRKKAWQWYSLTISPSILSYIFLEWMCIILQSKFTENGKKRKWLVTLATSQGCCIPHLGLRKPADIMVNVSFFLFFFFYFTILYWFCHISAWICHGYTHVPHPESLPLLLPLRTIPLGHPSAPAPSILDNSNFCVSECSVAQSCLTLCNPVDCCLPGSSVHGTFQARKLE